jgi:hypothetical protein
LTKANRSSVLSLDFFHSLAELGCGEDGSDESGADPSASMQDLFFAPPVFVLMHGDAFIIQVQGVFTRIHPGAVLVADSGGALGFLVTLTRRQ